MENPAKSSEIVQPVHLSLDVGVVVDVSVDGDGDVAVNATLGCLTKALYETRQLRHEPRPPLHQC